MSYDHPTIAEFLGGVGPRAMVEDIRQASIQLGFDTSKQVSASILQVEDASDDTSKQVSDTSKQVSDTSKQVSDTSKQVSASIQRAGGYARAASLTPERCREIAHNAIRARWAKHKKQPIGFSYDFQHD